MITAVRPNIQAYQMKAQAFKSNNFPHIKLLPELEKKILEGDPVAILSLGQRFPNMNNMKESAKLLDFLTGMEKRYPENRVVKELSEHVNEKILSSTLSSRSQPVHQHYGMRRC